ncbi:splicing factor, arginine/serine-rich 19-like [Agelaius phoeniceus]|uniref:splicing factor, arginine/serine-rich 19-like n=1 Tax=Agelaius phoeniceus TaxID=39638 RepID=UPI004054F17F
MEEANLASRAKAQELIQATNQILSHGPRAPNPTLPGLGGPGGDRRDSEGRGDSDKYLKKLHTQERAVEEVKLAIKPFYQRKDITKDEYKDILRKAVHKVPQNIPKI